MDFEVDEVLVGLIRFRGEFLAEFEELLYRVGVVLLVH